MAEVDIRIGGFSYELACRDGDEERLRMLAQMVDGKAAELARSMGELNEVRQLLFASLLIADELCEALAKPAGPTPPPPLVRQSDTIDAEVAAEMIEELADKVEALALRLEKQVARA